MNSRIYPQAPLPNPIRGADPGSFAEYTVKERFPAIVRELLASAELPNESQQALEALISGIPSDPVRFLVEPQAPDRHAWQDWITPYLNQDWLETPWLFIETYFYRRILEAVGYFGPGAGSGVDPYLSQKDPSLLSAGGYLQGMAARQERLLAGESTQQEALETLLLHSAWGNQADLSMWAAGQGPASQPGQSNPATRLVVNDLPLLISYLQSHKNLAMRIDLALDNCGRELLADVCLCDWLLAIGAAATIHLHAKLHPTYISDATIPDVHHLLAYLQVSPDQSSRLLGSRLSAALEQGALILDTDPYWTSPLAMWDMPASLRQSLAGSELLIVKGDANYRRLLGDRKWDYTTPLAQVLNYLPAPAVALRVLKAEIAIGIPPGKPESLQAQDPQWLVDGHWGMVQFYQPEG